MERDGLTLRQPDETLSDDEPFLADFPARQDLADRLLDAPHHHATAASPANTTGAVVP